MFLDLFAFQSFSASISSLTLGGLLSAFILVQDQSWGQRRIGGFPCVFSGFLFFPFFVPRGFFQDFAVALQELLARPKPDIVWCDLNGEPLSFVGPTVSAVLVSKDPSFASLAQLRFRHPVYFQAGGLHDHVDFWVGLSYTLQGLGCTPEQIAQYLGWRCTEMALFYTRHSNVSASLQLLERVTFHLCFKGLSACSAPL